MNKEPQDPLLLEDHEYDGIRELDNQLPRWWVWLFYITIIFSVIYMCYYHVFARGDLAEQGQRFPQWHRGCPGGGDRAGEPLQRGQSRAPQVLLQAALVGKVELPAPVVGCLLRAHVVDGAVHVCRWGGIRRQLGE